MLIFQTVPVPVRPPPVLATTKSWSVTVELSARIAYPSHPLISRIPPAVWLNTAPAMEKPIFILTLFTVWKETSLPETVISLALSVPVRLPPKVMMIRSPERLRSRPMIPPPAVTCKLEKLLIVPVVSREPPSKRSVSFPFPKSISPSPSKMAPSSRMSSSAPRESVELVDCFFKMTLFCAFPATRTKSFPLPVRIGAFRVELFNTRVSFPLPRKKDRFSA